LELSALILLLDVNDEIHVLTKDSCCHSKPIKKFIYKSTHGEIPIYLSAPKTKILYLSISMLESSFISTDTLSVSKVVFKSSNSFIIS